MKSEEVPMDVEFFRDEDGRGGIVVNCSCDVFRAIFAEFIVGLIESERGRKSREEIINEVEHWMNLARDIDDKMPDRTTGRSVQAETRSSYRNGPGLRDGRIFPEFIDSSWKREDTCSAVGNATGEEVTEGSR